MLNELQEPFQYNKTAWKCSRARTANTSNHSVTRTSTGKYKCVTCTNRWSETLPETHFTRLSLKELTMHRSEVPPTLLVMRVLLFPFRVLLWHAVETAARSHTAWNRM